MSHKNLPIVDWLQINSSAPGKFIISGEYSVVYDKHAIAATIDLRTRVTIRPNKESKVRLNLKNLNRIREWPTSSLTSYKFVSKYSDCLEYNDTLPGKLDNLLNPRYSVAANVAKEDSLASNVGGGKTVQVSEQLSSSQSQAIADLEKKAKDASIAFLLLYIGLGDSYCGSARPPLDVEVESSLPVGSGLGSSSAYSVALCGALMRVFRVAAEKYIISNWAFNVDKYFHGRPSGVDNNAVAMGGYILFQNGKIKATGVSHKAPIMVMLVDTGVSRSTKTLSDLVKLQFTKDPVRMNSLFSSMNEITMQIWRRMTDPEFIPRNIADYLEANQQYLDSLGVGHAKLNDIFFKARQLNLTAKQTGAGGGGTAFVLYDPSHSEDIEHLRGLLTDCGYQVHQHKVGCEGLVVKIEPDPSKDFLGSRDR